MLAVVLDDQVAPEARRWLVDQRKPLKQLEQLRTIPGCCERRSHPLCGNI